jgi:hypothetical protein
MYCSIQYDFLVKRFSIWCYDKNEKQDQNITESEQLHYYSNEKKRRNKDKMPCTNIHDRSLSWLGTVALLKNKYGWVNRDYVPHSFLVK